MWNFIYYIIFFNNQNTSIENQSNQENMGIRSYTGKRIWFNKNKQLQEKYKNTNWKIGK